jgi:hypothetical protein
LTVRAALRPVTACAVALVLGAAASSASAQQPVPVAPPSVPPDLGAVDEACLSGNDWMMTTEDVLLVATPWFPTPT